MTDRRVVSVSILKEFVPPPAAAAAGARHHAVRDGARGASAGRLWELCLSIPTGGTRRVWAFAMVLSWSQMLYLEFVRRADTSTFLRCHLHAFEDFGGLPQRCLYGGGGSILARR